ncbi:MAG: GGDEF and EAL domain-containing protein [Alphaproteobacteria bacterium]|nr:GGDEF and EAL domain-containing protein [Alphaproteobacteria bacterium]
MDRSALRSRRSRARDWLTRALCLAILALGAGTGFVAQAAAPILLDQGVSDITPWLQEAFPRDRQAADAGNASFVLELANPKRLLLHRIVTIDAGTGGIFRYLGGASELQLTAVMAQGQGSRAQLLDLGGVQAAELFLDPFAKASFTFATKGRQASASWKFWKPEILAASKRTETLVMGLLAGAALVMTAWLASLSVFRNSTQPAWAAGALAALIVLILGQSLLNVQKEVLQVSGSVMFACMMRYVISHLDWDDRRPRLALLFDAAIFALMGFSITSAFGVDLADPFRAVLLFALPVLIGLFAILDAFRTGFRAKALVPGIVLLALAALVPAFMPLDVAQHVPNLSLYIDALITSGALALSFAAAVPREPDLDEQSREELSEEGRKARESEYRYALGLAAAHQGLWDWNFDADTLFMSPSVEALLGLEAGALGTSERKWADRIAPEDVQIYADAMNAHRRQGNSSFALEMRMRHAKGGTRWIQLRASCVADSKGKAIRCIGVVSDITARKGQEGQRQSDDSIDAVTGLMQRSAYLKRLDNVLSSMKAGRGRRHGAVLAIDVDRLRTVIDSLGHEAGDKFLAQIARRLDHAVGPDDAVARLGNDEFAVFALGSHGDEDGAQVAQRIRDALTQPVAVGGREIYPAASIGLALIEPAHRNGGDVLREAEVAMYHAKRAGRGGFEIYQPQMKPRSADRLTMDADLRTALEREQIEIHYQPIVRLEDNSIAGFEALMRWRHPQRGMLSPAEFIPLAEETGLIVPLGSYAVKRAAAELRRWQTNFPVREPLFCSVNVSARQLMRAEFFDDVINTVNSHQLARLTLKLELTESVIMQNPDSMVDALTHLKDAGAGLALDDFGTGFSSLAYLQRFPFDTVKIDRSFVADMAHNQETPVVLRSIIRLAHDLDMSVVAEGVETQNEAVSLTDLKCEFAQGFLFGAPMSASAAYNFIASNMRGAPAPRGLPRPGSSPARIPRKL